MPSILSHFHELNTQITAITAADAAPLTVNALDKAYADIQRLSTIPQQRYIDANNNVILGDMAGGKVPTHAVIAAALEERTAHFSSYQFAGQVNLGVIANTVVDMLATKDIEAEQVEIAAQITQAATAVPMTTDCYTHLKISLERFIKQNGLQASLKRKDIVRNLFDQCLTGEPKVTLQKPDWLIDQGLYNTIEATYNKVMPILKTQRHHSLCDGFVTQLPVWLETGNVRIYTFGSDLKKLLSATTDHPCVLALPDQDPIPVTRCVKLVASADEALDAHDAATPTLKAVPVDFANPAPLFIDEDPHSFGVCEAVRANYRLYKKGELAKPVVIDPTRFAVSVAMDDNIVLGNNTDYPLDCFSLHAPTGEKINHLDLNEVNLAKLGIESHPMIAAKKMSIRMHGKHLVVLIRGSALSATENPGWLAGINDFINRVSVACYQQQCLNELRTKLKSQPDGLALLHHLNSPKPSTAPKVAASAIRRAGLVAGQKRQAGGGSKRGALIPTGDYMTAEL
jgi:hypothetical protein